MLIGFYSKRILFFQNNMTKLETDRNIYVARQERRMQQMCILQDCNRQKRWIHMICHYECRRVRLLWSQLFLEDFVSEVSIDVEVRSVYVVVTVIKVLWEIMDIDADSVALLFVYINMHKSWAIQ